MYLDVSFLVIQTSVDFRFTSSYCSVHLHYGRCYSMLKYWENSQMSVHGEQNCVMFTLPYKVMFDEGKMKCCSFMHVSVCIEECLCQKKIWSILSFTLPILSFTLPGVCNSFLNPLMWQEKQAVAMLSHSWGNLLIPRSTHMCSLVYFTFINDLWNLDPCGVLTPLESTFHWQCREPGCYTSPPVRVQDKEKSFHSCVVIFEN